VSSTLRDLEPGTVFAGGFRVVKKLGSGGMGAVYVAEQIATGRMRALKLMHPGMAESQDFREKFTLEARVGARIASEHVIEVVDAGVDEATGSPWLAMELLEGQDLATAVERDGAFSVERTISVLGDVCHALGAAHAAGIVHRDLKPENVFLTQTRSSRVVESAKVLDFGIAKVIADARSTNTGTIGSPFWMAPEQTERHALIGPQADVWAVGLLAFYMLTTRVYFRTADDELRSFHAFLRELIIDPLPTAGERASELGKALPPGFERWFARCVDRDPKARWSDARAALAGLREALGLPAASTPVTVPDPPVTGPVRISSDPAVGSSPTQTELLGSARTVAETLPSEDAHGPLPVQGPSPRLFVIGAAVVALLVTGGAIAMMKRPNVGPDPVPPVARDAAPPLAACSRGMVRVPEADLAMGSEGGAPEERPVHHVHVASFCVDATEVTAADYAECVKKKGCPDTGTSADWPQITKEDRTLYGTWCTAGKEQRTDHPMNCVAFDDASSYCRWAGKRLPTEEQWELAARGAGGRTYPWGHEPPDATRLNGCDRGCAQRGEAKVIAVRFEGDDGWEATSPVGTYAQGASENGAFDLAGNVAEWTDAAFCPYGESACGSSARVVRGGSWLSDTPTQVRATARTKASPVTRAPDIGFRCVK
jgi:formylglycine-generating enzyme required for sulfatase activity/serine/threonine protein kinase